jgi:hypothetical protein
MALLQQALAEGPAAGASSALQIPPQVEKVLFFNHHRGRLPEIVLAGGVIVVPKTETGRQRTAKAIKRLLGELRGKEGVSNLPWSVEGDDFRAAFRLVRDALVSEVQIAIEETGLTLYIMTKRLHSLERVSKQRTAQQSVVTSLETTMEKLYDRLRAWRQTDIMQLEPLGPALFGDEQQWSKKSITKDLVTPWRADAVSLEERAENINEIGCAQPLSLMHLSVNAPRHESPCTQYFFRHGTATTFHDHDRY